MGSEMCIRDRAKSDLEDALEEGYRVAEEIGSVQNSEYEEPDYDDCLLYTSDAADERSSVDLGGRRIIKKKRRE